jgi:hypothetical protein
MLAEYIELLIRLLHTLEFKILFLRRSNISLENTVFNFGALTPGLFQIS